MCLNSYELNYSPLEEGRARTYGMFEQEKLYKIGVNAKKDVRMISGRSGME